MTPGDWTRVREIYEQGIAGRNATFETAAPSWQDWDKSHLRTCRLVAFVKDGTVAGWAALSPVSSRQIYRGVAEVSVYVGNEFQGGGIGGKLLRQLIEESERKGLWTLQAGIFPENTASVALHKRCGFKLLGRHERIGCQVGVWRDTLLLERRSSIAGS